MCAEQVTPAVMPAYRGYNPWAYQGLVGCMDTTADITGSYPMGPGGGFTPSVFGGCMPFGGGMPFGMGMYGMGGYGPWSELMGMSAEQSMDYMNRIRSKQLNQGVELTRQTQDANHRASINNKMVAEKAAVLQAVIKDNNQDQVATAYENLKEAVKAKLFYESGKNATEHEIDTAAKTLYAEAMQGNNIPDDLRKHGDAPFLCGFKKALGGIGWLFMEKKSSIENIADIEGTQIPKSERAKEIAGGIVSLVLTAMGAVVLHKAYKGLGKTTVRVGTGASKALSHEERLAQLNSHIKDLEGDSRFSDMVQNNYYENIAELHQAHIGGEKLSFTKDEQELFDAYVQAREAASKVKADMFAAKHKKIMSS